MALAIPLHHVRALLIVDVSHRRARVRCDVFAVEPGNVGGAHGSGCEGPQVGEVEGGRGQTGPVPEDAPAGGRAEHGVAEARDEVRGRSCFGERGDQVLSGCQLNSPTGGIEARNRTATVRVHEGHDARSYGQSGAFDVCERDMAGVGRRRPLEDGERPAQG